MAPISVLPVEIRFAAIWSLKGGAIPVSDKSDFHFDFVFSDGSLAQFRLLRLSGPVGPRPVAAHITAEGQGLRHWHRRKAPLD